MLAIIESPYQLQNTISLFDELNVKNKDRKILIRDNGNKEQKKQYELNDNTSFFYLPAKGVKKIPLLLYFYARYFIFILFSHRLVFGDARSIICNPLIKIINKFNKEIYLVDDGLYLLSYVSKLKKMNLTIYTSLPIIKKPDQNFSIIKKKTEKFTKYQKNKSVSFIGQPFVELGFINEDVYMCNLNKIINSFKNKYKTFNYYVHRSESNVKVEKIKNVGFNVIYLPVSIENYFYKNEAPTGLFVSFNSTALLNIKNAHKNAEFYFCENNLTVVDLKTKLVMSASYKALKDSGVKKLN